MREMEMEIEKPLQSSRGGAETVLNFEPNSSASIVYHPLFGTHDELILLELDEKLLPDVLNQRVTLRGQPDEYAVLCTQSKTYAIKFVGTSNSVLLIPPNEPVLWENTEDSHETEYQNKAIAPVIKVATGTMELVEVAPKLDQLKLLLCENPYKFDEVPEMDEIDGMDGNRRRLYGWNDLIARVQASDDQLRSGLDALLAVEIDGYWRIVDDNYMDSILSMLLNNAILNDWSLNALNETAVVSALESDGYPGKIANHCLKVYGSKVNEGVWTLDEKRVCMHFARRVLSRGKMKLETFMSEWMQKIPEGMEAKFDMLEGEILTEKLGIEMWVYTFSVSSLPSTPAKRFSMLFRERPKWEWKDLEPYIRDLSVPGLSSEGLLLKFTRRTQPTADAEPVFSAR